MGTGKLINNKTFFEGYEGETEIVLMCKEKTDYSIHLWDGYLDDIFGEPTLDGNGWAGFTRDIHQLEGVFSENITLKEIDSEEYLDDLLSYANHSFDYDESTEVFALIADFLKYTIENRYTVVMKRI